MGKFFFAFIDIHFFLLSVKFLTLLEKKVLIGFGQTGDHKTLITSWGSTRGKTLKGNKYKGIGDFNF